MLKLAIIIGSTRPGRVGEAVARWVHEVAQQRSDAEFELVDLASLRAALAAGCEDLLTCSETPSCPVPFEFSPDSGT